MYEKFTGSNALESANLHVGDSVIISKHFRETGTVVTATGKVTALDPVLVLDDILQVLTKDESFDVHVEVTGRALPTTAGSVVKVHDRHFLVYRCAFLGKVPWRWLWILPRDGESIEVPEDLLVGAEVLFDAGKDA